MATKLSESALRRRARERFAIAERMEKEYARSLRQLTRQIDHMVKGMVKQSEPGDTAALQAMLRQYSQAISPWARSVAGTMLARIARKDETAWMQLGKTIGKSLREELDKAPTGDMLRQMLNEQVTLITSLPLEAAERVHTLATEGLMKGRRASEIAKDILETGSVTESRAKLIARTEVARVASGLTMARAKHVGSTHYVWRSSGDSTVRESHKKMNGKVIAFDEPPEVEPGQHYHAGAFPNCRCWIDPIFEED